MSTPLPPQFASAHTRAQLAKALLLTNAAIALLSVVVAFLPGGSAAGASDDDAATIEESINPAELIVGLVALAQLAVFVATVVVFLMWLHRAYKNLRAFGARTEHSPGWAVGFWFIPIINLFRPYQIFKELWAKSDPAVDSTHGFARPGAAARDTALVGAWWAAWIIASIVDRIYGRLAFQADTAGALSALTPLGVASDLLTATSAVLAFLVVKAVDSMQEEKAAQLRVSSWPTPPPPPASFDHPYPRP